MSSGSRPRPFRSQAVRVSRALIAILIASSFFTTVVSFGAASSAGAATMACCIGKPGHESGSCSSGLLEPVKTQPEPEVLCGQEPAPPSTTAIKIINVEDEAADGGHCNLHALSGDKPTDPAKQSEPEASSTNSEKSNLPGIYALTSPCPAECGTCSVNYTRRPRPREQSTLSSPTRPCLHLTRRVLTSEDPQVTTLDTKWMQLRPRAPPDPYCL
jgi:hypothetical protein